MVKTIGVRVTIDVGMNGFYRLSDDKKVEVLNCFQNELTKIINNTTEMTFLGGSSEYIKGIETDNGCFIKVVKSKGEKV